MGKAYSSAEIIKILKGDGWVVDRIKGSHHVFRHPSKAGVVVVPHPKKGLPVGTVKSIEKQAGLSLQ
jgi:predicted RNA binding protein YcfA (HicA-like mRNA interferase family)